MPPDDPAPVGTPVSAVWLNGAVVDGSDAFVPYDDHGFTVGDGAFETLKVAGGRAFALTRHLRRLARSLSSMGLDGIDLDEMRVAIETVAAAHGGDGFVRATVTAGQGPLGSPRDGGPFTRLVAIRPGSLRETPCEVATLAEPRNERGLLAGVKSTSYAENVIALARAQALGADEAIFGDTQGRLCEGTGSNVFLVHEGRLITPTLATGCLAGVTRELLLEALDGDAIEYDVPLTSLADAAEAFLVSTGREVQPIRAVDGRILSAAPGPITRRARAAWLAAYGSPTSPIDP